MILKPDDHPAECPFPGTVKFEDGHIIIDNNPVKQEANDLYFAQMTWVCDNCLKQADNRHTAGWHTILVELTSHGGNFIGSLEEELLHEVYQYTLENALHFCSMRCAGDYFHKLDGMGGLDIQLKPMDD